MQPKRQTLTGILLLIALPILFSFRPGTPHKPLPKPVAPKIQVAILLDVSGSMDGLIDQAKAQLWNLVSVLGRADCNRGTPQIEIALYEYGRTNNDAAKGYVKQIQPFTRDLDSLSKSLFALNTDGGEEYCAHAIFTSVQDLAWDGDPGTYKAVFIAGNESFRQGKLTWEQACAAARAKNIVVNTIYCGAREQGIREFWNLNSECGSGSFTNINSNAAPEEIPTPYDSALYTLNDRFNGTMVGYGLRGRAAGVAVASVDKMNYEHSRGSAAKRAEVKANRALYNNSSWEMVDAYEADTSFYRTADRSSLPDSLASKTPAQLKAILDAKRAERDAVRSQIATISKQRDAWITDERKRRAANKPQEATLETEMEKILKEQVQRNGFVIK